MKRTIVLCLILSGLTPAPARAAWNECSVSGDAGTWQVRKISIPEERAISLSLTLNYPRATVTDESNWHLFSGIWVLYASNLARTAYGFLDATSLLGPPYVRATFQGQDVIGGPVPSSDRPSNGAQGAYFVPAEIQGGHTYYVVAYASGNGSFTGSLNYSGGALSCETVEATGRIYDFDASDFTGGTQVMTPGHAHVSDARLTFSTSERMVIGGIYAYQPQPLPPARLLLEHDRGSSLFENRIALINTSTIHNWKWTADYTGKSNTILIQAFGFDLPTSA